MNDFETVIFLILIMIKAFTFIMINLNDFSMISLSHIMRGKQQEVGMQIINDINLPIYLVLNLSVT